LIKNSNTSDGEKLGAKDAAVTGAMMGVTFALTSMAVGYLVIRYIVVPNIIASPLKLPITVSSAK
jgi:hypothetical protein